MRDTRNRRTSSESAVMRRHRSGTSKARGQRRLSRVFPGRGLSLMRPQLSQFTALSFPLGVSFTRRWPFEAPSSNRMPHGMDMPWLRVMAHGGRRYAREGMLRGASAPNHRNDAIPLPGPNSKGAGRRV